MHEGGKGRGVVLVSGGMDSCVTAAIAKDAGYDLAFLHVNYGQRTEGRELRAFHDIAAYYHVQTQLVVALPHLKTIGGSSLTDSGMAVSPADLDREGIPTSYVPFRNANLMAVATSWAEVIGAERVFIGAVEEDSSGYPDCREVFYEAFNRVIALGTRPETRISVAAPLIHMSKGAIVKKGAELGAPLHLSWSCYQSEEEACGLCDSCALRIKAFRDAGLEDRIAYAGQCNATP
ncbi:MAG: 7-cyano-7-deazaguanine synthase QueC [Candidatus Latescibacterota bacterium]